MKFTQKEFEKRMLGIIRRPKPQEGRQPALDKLLQIARAKRGKVSP